MKMHEQLRRSLLALALASLCTGIQQKLCLLAYLATIVKKVDECCSWCILNDLRKT